MGDGFESIGTFWLSNKRFVVINIISAVAPWGLWKTRNDVCFCNASWRNMQELLLRVAILVRNWQILCSENNKDALKTYTTEWRRISSLPQRLAGLPGSNHHERGASAVPVWKHFVRRHGDDPSQPEALVHHGGNSRGKLEEGEVDGHKAPGVLWLMSPVLGFFFVWLVSPSY